MNKLPEAIVDNIFKYKHQLEFKHVMDELTDNTDNLYFNSNFEFIKFLILNAEDIDCVILSSNHVHQRICVDEYIKRFLN